MKRTGPSNEQLQATIEMLRKLASEQKVNLWKRIATDLAKPTRKRAIVNLYKIAKNTKENEAIIVPGKVLATGDISHKLTVGAYAFSEEAKEKITKAKGECLTIQELVQKNPKGQNVRIIG